MNQPLSQRLKLECVIPDTICVTDMICISIHAARKGTTHNNRAALVFFKNVKKQTNISLEHSNLQVPIDFAQNVLIWKLYCNVTQLLFCQ